MADYSSSSFNTPKFAPFQSGCNLCYPSKDYVKQKGGKNKKNIKGGNNTLVSSAEGKNLFKKPVFTLPIKTLVKNNYGKSYNTSAGGSKNNDYKKNS